MAVIFAVRLTFVIVSEKKNIHNHQITIIDNIFTSFTGLVILVSVYTKFSRFECKRAGFGIFLTLVGSDSPE